MTTAFRNPGKGLFHNPWNRRWFRQASCPLNTIIQYVICVYVCICQLLNERSEWLTWDTKWRKTTCRIEPWSTLACMKTCSTAFSWSHRLAWHINRRSMATKIDNEKRYSHCTTMRPWTPHREGNKTRRPIARRHGVRCCYRMHSLSITRQMGDVHLGEYKLR